MRIFVTGATGFIGAAIVPELLKAGHQVLGMTRSEKGAEALKARGAEAHFGALEDPESLRRGAEKAEGVIHCAFDHDFTNFMANCEKDKRAIEALGSALRGSDRPLVITSGVGMGSPGHGQLAREDIFNLDHPNPRKVSEITGEEVAKNGVNVSVVRLPQVHDPYKQGLITPYIAIAREKGTVGYVGDGSNRWAAAHVLDVARLYRLALERAEPGARYHAVAEEGVPAREIAEAVGRGLKLPVISVAPEQAGEQFGWMSMFVSLDIQASGEATQQKLDWHPTGPTLLEDLNQGLF